MADVVEEDGQFGATAFFVGYGDSLLFEDIKCTAHEVEGAEHVAETGVHGARIDKMREPQLLDAPLPLEIGMLDDLQYHRVIDREKPVVDGVVDNLAFGPVSGLTF